jgi:Multiubiquitin
VNEPNAGHHVRIHIDQQAYSSPNPTTGVALYKLADLGKHLGLFREVEGNREDKLIPRDDTVIHLKEDEHFHSEEVFTIIVEGTPHIWLKPEITYVEVVTLEVPDYAQHPEITYSVKYRNGPSHKPEGTLSLGGKVKVKNGMIFNVSETGQS